MGYYIWYVIYIIRLRKKGQDAKESSWVIPLAGEKEPSARKSADAERCVQVILLAGVKGAQRMKIRWRGALGVGHAPCGSMTCVETCDR